MITDKLLDLIKAYVNDAVEKALDARGYKKINEEEGKSTQNDSEDDFEQRFKQYQEQKKKAEKTTSAKDEKLKEQKNKESKYKAKTPFDEFNDLFEKFKKYEQEANSTNEKSYQQQQNNQNQYKKSYSNNSQTTRNVTEEQHYKTLELPNGASWTEIKAAYKSEMKKYHPDKFYDNDKKRQTAEKISQKINEAYVYFEKKYNKK